jgi:phosphate starvation-inducible membrane PsiE
METNEFQNIWKNIDSEIMLKSKEELDQIFTVKSRKIINKFLLIFTIDLITCAGLIVFLIVTLLNRPGDLIYQIINSLLCLFTLFAFIASLFSYNKLQNNEFNIPLKDWLEQRITLLKKWLLGKYSKSYMVLLPILVLMIMLSIHVYYEYKPFIEVMKNKESIIGLLVGYPIGLLVAFFAINKIRKFELRNLEYLKELHQRLCNAD